MRRIVMFAVIAAGIALAACATEKLRSKQTVLDETLKTYAATVRWGEIEQAEAFVDPTYRRAHPLSSLDRARFKQVQVSGYNEQPAVAVSDNEVSQVVEIGLVNVNTQAVRSIVDRQSWHWDEAAKRWWLTSGLPEIGRRE